MFRSLADALTKPVPKDQEDDMADQDQDTKLLGADEIAAGAPSVYVFCVASMLRTHRPGNRLPARFQTLGRTGGQSLFWPKEAYSHKTRFMAATGAMCALMQHGSRLEAASNRAPRGRSGFGRTGAPDPAYTRVAP